MIITKLVVKLITAFGCEFVHRPPAKRSLELLTRHTKLLRQISGARLGYATLCDHFPMKNGSGIGIGFLIHHMGENGETPLVRVRVLSEWGRHHHLSLWNLVLYGLQRDCAYDGAFHTPPNRGLQFDP